jgi:hypothetical protein
MTLIFTPETAVQQPGQSQLFRYWTKQARDIFARFPSVQSVEVVRTGRKTDAVHLVKDVLDPGWAVIVASTGGKWGKSRRDFMPA